MIVESMNDEEHLRTLLEIITIGFCVPVISLIAIMYILEGIASFRKWYAKR